MKTNFPNNAMGIYLPLITTNCAVLGVAQLVIDHAQMISLLGVTSMNMGYAVLYGLFAGLGFTLAIVLMSGLREKITRLPIAKSLKGRNKPGNNGILQCRDRRPLRSFFFYIQQDMNVIGHNYIIVN